MKRHDRVTAQPRHWYDGQPIANWPDPQFLGTVRKVATIAGVPCARVMYDSGRVDWTSQDRLTVVEGGEA